MYRLRFVLSYRKTLLTGGVLGATGLFALSSHLISLDKSDKNDKKRRKKQKQLEAEEKARHHLQDIDPEHMREVSHLTREWFRGTATDVPEDEFHNKWNSVLKLQQDGPMRFFRSFVRAYYTDMSYKGLDKGCGPVCMGYGDAHFQNFGWIVFKNNQPAYVFNDLDDSGYCPVGLDILRYFVVLRLYNKDGEDQIAQLASYYSNALKARGEFKEPLDEPVKSTKGGSKTLRAMFTPARLHQKLSNMWVINAPTDFMVADKTMVAAIINTFERHPMLHMYKPLEVRRYLRHYMGGSGGLDRYWVTAKDPQGQLRFIEFKEYTKYFGTGAKEWGDNPPLSYRIEYLAMLFWYKYQRDLDFQVQIKDKAFHVRNRIKKIIQPDKLSPEGRMALCRAQLAIMANYHQKYWSGMDPSEWLVKNSKIIADRWTKIYFNCREELLKEEEELASRPLLNNDAVGSA